jgi:predicted Fe-Mo cluster-binding NifX family protein
MIVAVPVWQERVSPVFDVAGQVLVVELSGAAELSRRTEALSDQEPDARVRRLQDLGVHTLICGAVSRPLEALLASRGIEVISRICGNVEEVLPAFQSGQLRSDRFAMPGCCGRQQRNRRGRCRRNQPFQP